MKLQNILLALSMSSLTAGVALAKGASEKNCEIKGKMSHVKDEAACTKKKGTWKPSTAAAPAADTGAAATAPAGGTTAPAAGTEAPATK